MKCGWKKPYTSIAVAAYENNTKRLNLLHIHKIEHSVAVYLIIVNEVVKDKLMTRTCVVDENKYTEYDCTHFQQFGILCPHIMKGFVYLEYLRTVSAMPYQKWSYNIFPKYIKVNVIYDKKKRMQFRYNFHDDMYEVKYKCNKWSDI